MKRTNISSEGEKEKKGKEKSKMNDTADNHQRHLSKDR
jgi:hypothetical protein